MKKRFFSLVLALTLVFALVLLPACGNKGALPDGATSTPTQNLTAFEKLNAKLDALLLQQESLAKQMNEVNTAIRRLESQLATLTK